MAKRQLDEDGIPVQKQRKTIDSSLAYMGPMERSVRGSTKAKTQTTEEADKIRAKQQERAMKVKMSIERPVKTDFKQKDLLVEGLDTEVHKYIPTHELNAVLVSIARVPVAYLENCIVCMVGVQREVAGGAEHAGERARAG